MCLCLVLACLAYEYKYAAAVSLRRSRGTCREAVLSIRGAYGKSNRAAGPLCRDVLVLVLGDVEGGRILGAEFAGDKAGEVAELRRNHTERADD